MEQTVAVTAAAALVNTTSGSLGGLVDEQRMFDLPLITLPTWGGAAL